MSTFALAELPNARRSATFVAPNAKIRFGQEIIEGEIAVAADGDAVAAVCRVNDDRLSRYAQRDNLGAVADTIGRAGVSSVQTVWLSTAVGSSAWNTSTPREEMSAPLQRWRPRAMLALMTRNAAPVLAIPRGSRPAGDEVCRLSLKGDITESNARALISSIEDAEGQTIHLEIVNSFGGRARAGIELHNALVRHPHLVITHVVENAQSAAAVVMLGGDVRTMQADARVMVHEPHMTADALTADELIQSAKDCARIADDMAAIVAARTGNDFDMARIWIAAETLLDAGQALDLGFAHQVINDQAPVIPVARRVRTAPINGPYAVAARSKTPPLLEHGRSYVRGSVVRFADKVWRAKRDTFPMLPGSLLLPDNDPVVWEQVR